MKIILSDLEKHLYPERYPYFNGYFADCTNYLSKMGDKKSQCIMNISFMVKLTKLSLSIKNDELRILSNLLFEKIVEHHFDWQKAYNWQDLKLFLMYFMFFSKAKSIREIENLFSNTLTLSLIRKYQPIQN